MSRIVGWESHAILSPSLYVSAISRDPLIMGGWAIRRVRGEGISLNSFNLYWVGDVRNREIAKDAIPLNDEILTLEQTKELAERLEVARTECYDNKSTIQYEETGPYRDPHDWL